MLLLAFLDSPGVFFVLAMIGIVDCTFGRLPIAVPRPVLFPFFCAWNSRFASVWMGQNGNITIFLAATVVSLLVVLFESFTLRLPSHAVTLAIQLFLTLKQ